MSARARMHAVISGVVQGVGFRFYAVHQARALGLTGWVRNQPDGSVEVVAEGEDGLLRQYADDLKRGPRAAHVSGIVITPQSYRGEFEGFSVRFPE